MIKADVASKDGFDYLVSLSNIHVHCTRGDQDIGDDLPGLESKERK
jgi:hypothetical protein